jgi:hypothetical protein
MKHKWLLTVYFVILLFFIIYSYTQVDLNLTLSGNSVYQSIQTALTQIGYFNRLLSGTIFLVFLGLLFSIYLFCLHQLIKGKLETKTIKWLIGVSVILLFAYPAFSHDLFNYMFDARIVTRYGLDPHFFKALDFPFDPWVRFMRWTHRYYPYGPGWLILTLVPSYLGMGKFVLTLFLFKLMFLGFHLGNIWLIWQIGDEWGSDKRIFSSVFYALNPLVMIESLVSPHNEVMLWFFALTAIYFLIKRTGAGAIILLVISVSMKYLSVILFPLFWWTKPTNKFFYIYAFWLWVIALIPVVLSRELYSWYAIPIVGLATLTGSRLINILTIAVSAGLLMRYWPFLLKGNYGPVTENYQNLVLLGGTLVVGFLLLIIWRKQTRGINN